MPPAPTSVTSLTDWKALHGDTFKNRKVLVTGGAGFIGSHLAEALSTLGSHVVVLDDLSGGSTDNLKHLPAVHFIRGSILDTSLLSRCAQGCELVFHQAALGSVPASVNHPRRYMDVNVGGTLNVLEVSRQVGARRVMFAASSSAYGDSEELPKTESMPVRPKSPYAASKVACEAMLTAWSGSYGLDTVSLRYFNIFGPRQNANSAYAAVIAAFAKAMAGGQNPVVYGDGEQSRDFTYVDNAVHANLLAAARREPLNGAVINVACGERVSVNLLAQAMTRLFGSEELAVVYEAERAGDVKHSLADLTLAQALLGYRPIVPFADGLGPAIGRTQPMAF